MRLLKGGKLYKSDSCLPIQISTPFNENKKRSHTHSSIRTVSKVKAFNLKKVIRVKNRNKTINIPALNIR